MRVFDGMVVAPHGRCRMPVQRPDIDGAACAASWTMHVMPATMAQRIIGDHSGDRSAFQRSTTWMVAL